MSWANAKEWGWRGVWLFTIVWLVALTFFVVVLLNGVANVDVTPLRDDKEIKIAPASGVEGFAVEGFCADPMTKVAPFLAPDASGITYQLSRVRAGKTESVTIVKNADGETRIAKHYYSTTVGQQSEDAVVNAEAWKCIERRSK